MKRITLLLAVLFFLSCKKKYDTIEYAVVCTHCDVTYVDENAHIVTRTDFHNSFSYTFEKRSDYPLTLAAQSKLCEDLGICSAASWSPADSLKIEQDSVEVIILLNGEVVADQKRGGKKYVAASVTY